MRPRRLDIAYARGIGQLISLREAAKIIGCSIDRARYLEFMGHLGTIYKIGASLRVTRLGVEAYLIKKRKR